MSKTSPIQFLILIFFAKNRESVSQTLDGSALPFVRWGGGRTQNKWTTHFRNAKINTTPTTGCDRKITLTHPLSLTTCGERVREERESVCERESRIDKCDICSERNDRMKSWKEIGRFKGTKLKGRSEIRTETS